MKKPLAELVAIKALIAYAADAPSTVCEEGYWDDMEEANTDGMRQEKSEAAKLIRNALRALKITPPKGYRVCSECFEDLRFGHNSQCSREVA